VRDRTKPSPCTASRTSSPLAASTATRAERHPGSPPARPRTPRASHPFARCHRPRHDSPFQHARLVTGSSKGNKRRKAHEATCLTVSIDTTKTPSTTHATTCIPLYRLLGSTECLLAHASSSSSNASLFLTIWLPCSMLVYSLRVLHSNSAHLLAQLVTVAVRGKVMRGRQRMATLAAPSSRSASAPCRAQWFSCVYRSAFDLSECHQLYTGCEGRAMLAWCDGRCADHGTVHYTNLSRTISCRWDDVLSSPSSSRARTTTSSNASNFVSTCKSCSGPARE
jgi:hypothetical protein